MDRFIRLVNQYSHLSNCFLNVTGGCLGLVRQLAYFGSDDGEASAVLSGACGFNTGVQR
ncbi:hypothetical protein D3C81_2337920 [compost metagenome]